MPIDPNVPTVQAGPYTARNYDGSTPEKTFNWDTPEGRKLQRVHGRTFDALSRVRKSAAMESDSTVTMEGATKEILARGLESLDALPPWPLPGEHASLSLADLAVSLAVAMAHESWCATPLLLTPYGFPGVTVVPHVVMQRIA